MWLPKLVNGTECLLEHVPRSTTELVAGSCKGIQDKSKDSERPPRLLKGGEAAALAHLDTVCADIKFLATFSKPDTNPLKVVPGAPVSEASTTLLSPFLAHGCLSPRTVYQKITTCLEQYRGKVTTPPQSLVGQLFWRDHFHLEAFLDPTHTRSLAVDWHPAPDERLLAWEAGVTGVPLVDAAMRQLVTTGWLHHILRHVVACFLTRGALWVSWEHGMRVFERHLIDHDPAINAGNWQWLAGCNYFFTYHRVYNFETFAKRHDPREEFVRAWIPELRTYKGRAYALVRRGGSSAEHPASGGGIRCYPDEPIVDLVSAKRENLARMDHAYCTAPSHFLEMIPTHARQEICKERGLKLLVSGGPVGNNKSAGHATTKPKKPCCTDKARVPICAMPHVVPKANAATAQAASKREGQRKRERCRKGRVQGAWAAVEQLGTE